MKNHLLILMIFIGMSSCTAVLRTKAAYSVPGKIHVYNQDQISAKFGSKSNLNSIFKTNEVQNESNRFIIDTDKIYSFEEENFHSLTYLLAYPDQPDRIVNLIFFSNDYQNYHPAIVEYDLTADEVVANQPIPRSKIKTIPIRNGEDYTTALNKAISTKLEDCVIITVETFDGKCESGQHGIGEPCNYADGPGAAKVSYQIIYDFANCNDNTGRGNGGAVM